MLLTHLKGLVIQNKRVLFLCTGNSCRSQIAEGLANKYLNNCKKNTQVKDYIKKGHTLKEYVTENCMWEETLGTYYFEIDIEEVK